MILATLYRFGGELTVLANTGSQAEKLLLADYTELFKKMNNGEDPAEEISDNPWDEGKTFIEAAKEDIEYRRIEVGIVDRRI